MQVTPGYSRRREEGGRVVVEVEVAVVAAAERGHSWRDKVRWWWALV